MSNTKIIMDHFKTLRKKVCFLTNTMIRFVKSNIQYIEQIGAKYHHQRINGWILFIPIDERGVGPPVNRNDKAENNNGNNF